MSVPNFYLLALGIILVALALVVVRFEGRRPRAREIVVLSVMTALAVAGRAAFFMLPQFKPVAALVIITGVALGAESGFLVGVLAAFVSNFIFGQGPWTPFQMLAFGLIGLLAGLLFYRKERPTTLVTPVTPVPPVPLAPSASVAPQLAALKRSKRGGRLRLALLCVYGGVSVLVLYGLIVDMAYLLIFSESVSTETLLAVLASGLPFNILHAVATVFFLLVLARPLLEKLERVKLKFGLMGGRTSRTTEQGKKTPGTSMPVVVLLSLVFLMSLFAPQSALAQPNSSDSPADAEQSVVDPTVDPATDVRKHLIEASQTGKVVTFGYEGTPQQPAYIWTFDGARLEPWQAEQLPPLDLSVTVTQRALAGETTDTLTLDFALQGDLPLSAMLAVALPASLNSAAALSLYSYDTSTATYVLVPQPVTREDGYASFTITSNAALALSVADLSTVSSGGVGQPSLSSSDLATPDFTETGSPQAQSSTLTPWILPTAVAVVLIIIGVVILLRFRRARAITALRAGFRESEEPADNYFREIPSIDELIADEIEEPKDPS
jgi:energy-coupling factor transport system substrate-specific component